MATCKQGGLYNYNLFNIQVQMSLLKNVTHHISNNFMLYNQLCFDFDDEMIECYQILHFITALLPICNDF